MGQNADGSEDNATTQGDGLWSASSDSESIQSLSTSYLLTSSSTGGRGDLYKYEGEDKPGRDGTTGLSGWGRSVGSHARRSVTSASVDLSVDPNHS